MSTNHPLSTARAGVPARQAGKQAQPMGIPTLVPPAPPARPSPPLPLPEEPLNVTNELQSICGHGGKSNYMVRLGGRGRRKVRASGGRAAGFAPPERRGCPREPQPRSHRAQARSASPPALWRGLNLARHARAGGCRLRGAHPTNRASLQVARRAEARPTSAKHLKGDGVRGLQQSHTSKVCPPFLVLLSGLLSEPFSRAWQGKAAPLPASVSVGLSRTCSTTREMHRPSERGDRHPAAWTGSTGRSRGL